MAKFLLLKWRNFSKKSGEISLNLVTLLPCLGLLVAEGECAKC